MIILHVNIYSYLCELFYAFEIFILSCISKYCSISKAKTVTQLYIYNVYNVSHLLNYLIDLLVQHTHTRLFHINP